MRLRRKRSRQMVCKLKAGGASPPSLLVPVHSRHFIFGSSHAGPDPVNPTNPATHLVLWRGSDRRGNPKVCCGGCCDLCSELL